MLLILAAVGASAQSNFKIENGLLVWQHVYEGDAPMHMLSDIHATDGQTTATLVKHKINYQAQGLKTMTAPFIVQNYLNARVQIDNKDGRYRVTLIQLVSINTNKGMGPLDEPTDFEKVFLKKGEWRTGAMYTKSISVIDKDLEGLFAPVKKEDW